MIHLLQVKTPIKWPKTSIHLFCRVKNGVVMLSDCTGEYNNASVLPGERNITLFTVWLCPKKRREKQPVSLVDGNRGQSDCNVRHNYWSMATCRGCAASLTAPHGLLVAAQTMRTHQWCSSALKMSIIKFASWTNANYPAVRRNIAAVPCYICYNLLNMMVFLGKFTLFNTEISHLWIQQRLVYNVGLVVVKTEWGITPCVHLQSSPGPEQKLAEVTSGCFLVPLPVENLWAEPWSGLEQEVTGGIRAHNTSSISEWLQGPSVHLCWDIK